MRNVLKRMKKQLSDFYFLNYRENLSKLTIFSTKMTITRKIKIGKVGKNIGFFFPIQHILHLSCKFDFFWKKETNI